MVWSLRRGPDDGSFREDLDPDLDGAIVYETLLAAGDVAERTGVDPALLRA